METTIDAPDAAPSFDDMVNAGTNGEAHSGSTLLDEMTITFDTDDDDAPVMTIAEPRKRGRPRGSGNATPRETKTPARKKAEIAEENEKLKSDLAAERARNDAGKLKELATSITMASYLAFGWAGEMRGPHWGLTEKEATDIGESGAVAMAPYAEQIAKQLPWVVFAGTLGKALYERVKIDRALVAQQERGGSL